MKPVFEGTNFVNFQKIITFLVVLSDHIRVYLNLDTYLFESLKFDYVAYCPTVIYVCS